MATTTNPTDPNAPQTPPETQQPGQVDPNQFKTDLGTTGLIGADNKDVAQATQTQWNVTPDQTVEGRIAGIIGSDSPLNTMARTQATQQAAARGLANSSMAVQAGENAVIQNALPIAAQDAQTAATAAQNNAQTANQTSQYNTTQLNTVQLQKMDEAFKANLANADAQTQAFITRLQGAVQQNLGNIEANYKTLMQASQSASDTYRQGITSITAILQNADMTTAAKQAAVDNVLKLMQSNMSILGSMNGIEGLDQLLQFS